MPQTRVVFYREDDGTVPLLNWLDELGPKATVKCRLRLERLKQLGHELRRPEADYLRDGIYELRVSLQGRQYRILYFFHGKRVIVTHGFFKKTAAVPEEELARAQRWMDDFVTRVEQGALRL